MKVAWCAQSQQFTSLVQGLALIVSVIFGGDVAEGIHGKISSLWRGSESVVFPVFGDVLSQLSAGERQLLPMQRFCGSFSFQQWMTHLSLWVRRSFSWF